MTFQIPAISDRDAALIKDQTQERRLRKKLPAGGWVLMTSYVFKSREKAVGLMNEYLEHLGSCDLGGCRWPHEAKVIKRGPDYLVIYRTTPDNNE